MLLSSSNRKCQPYPLLSYFSVVVCLKCLLHHILSLIAYTFRGNRAFVFIIIVQFMTSSNCRIRFGLQILFVCLYTTSSHYHHCANLSEDIELMKCLSDIFCVWVRLNIFSQLSIIQHMGLCVFSLPISTVMIERIYTLSYYHHQIGSMNYYPLFRARSRNNGMRYMFLYILLKAWWRHQMETISALLAFRVGYSSVSCEFSTQRRVTRSFDVFFNLRLFFL